MINTHKYSVYFAYTVAPHATVPVATVIFEIKSENKETNKLELIGYL
jgi:hypothetical protein